MSQKKILLLSSGLVLVGVLLVVSGFGYYQPGNQQKKPTQTLNTTASSSANFADEDFLVTRVIDGDTIEISGGEKVRYIGIDTPETVDPRRPVGCFGKEASRENQRLVEGKKVSLVKDISDTDKFGRLLRYVYVKEGDKVLFVNDYLVREGFAKAVTFPPDVKFANQFVAAEREARENQRGLWQKCF